jgi:hypothetical protein
MAAPEGSPYRRPRWFGVLLMAILLQGWALPPSAAGAPFEEVDPQPQAGTIPAIPGGGAIGLLLLPLILPIACLGAIVRSQPPQHRFGRNCRTVADCDLPRKCLPHRNQLGDVTRQTCEQPCSGWSGPQCPADLRCITVSEISSYQRICLP